MLHIFKDRKVQSILDGVAAALPPLTKGIADVENTQDPLARFVRYFQVMEGFAATEGTQKLIADAIEAVTKANTSKRYDSQLSALRTIQHYVSLANRDTTRGPANDENLKLGGIYGLFTLPVRHWRQSFNDSSNAFAASDKKVIEGQARGIIDPCLPELRSSIATVTTPARK